MSNRKVVLGLGNLLMGDEGFGIHAIEYLKRSMPSDSTFEFIDGGVLGLNLLPLVLDCSHLLVIDVVEGNQPAGAIIEVSKERILAPTEMKLSEHQIGFQEVLGVVNFHSSLPKFIHTIGVQPKTIAFGIELSAEVRKGFPEVINRVKATMSDWSL